MSTSYRIEITRIDTIEKTVTKNFITSKTPTEIKANSGYGGRDEVVFAEEYQAREVQESNTTETAVLSQQVNDLDLVTVISAINGISHGGKADS